MSALIRKSLYFLTIAAATFFILHYIPTFAQQTPKFTDFYPPTAIPTIRQTPTPTKPKTPTVTPIGGIVPTQPVFISGSPVPTNVNPSVSKPSKTPTPKPTKEPKSDVANLVERIRDACKNGVVTSDTLDCLDDIDPPLSSGIKSRLVNSAISFFYLQCVGFVRSATVLLFGADFSIHGNAIDFATHVPPGYQYMQKYSAKIKVNDIPIWDVGTYGHIAIVAKVYSANTFQVAEANWGVWGSVQLRNISLSEPNLKGWLRKN